MKNRSTNNKFNNTKGNKKRIKSPIISQSEFFTTGREFHLNITLSGKTYLINCIQGTQKLKWLLDYILYLHTKDFCLYSGLIVGYKDKEDKLINIIDIANNIIYKTFENGDKITFLLKREYDICVEEQKQAKKNRSMSPIKKKKKKETTN